MGLSPLPASFARTREALHRVAEQVVAPARKPDNEIALTQTPGGFGTPSFAYRGQAVQVRVDAGDLVVADGGVERREPLTSIAAAAAFTGAELFPRGVPEDATPLGVDAAAAAILGEFFAFSRGVLERARQVMAPADEPSAINLWPEHFDLAFEAGPEGLGRRANYGASPGDAEHAEPYLYVGPWQPPPPGALWNATAFAGAELAYADLVVAEAPDAVALAFLLGRRDALDG